MREKLIQKRLAILASLTLALGAEGCDSLYTYPAPRTHTPVPVVRQLEQAVKHPNPQKSYREPQTEIFYNHDPRFSLLKPHLFFSHKATADSPYAGEERKTFYPREYFSVTGSFPSQFWGSRMDMVGYSPANVQIGTISKTLSRGDDSWCGIFNASVMINERGDGAYKFVWCIDGKPAVRQEVLLLNR